MWRVKMKRSLKTERLFSLGDWKNIRFHDEFLEIPEEYLTDKKFIDDIRMLQLLNVDVSFREYVKLQESELVGKDLDEALERLNELRDEMYGSIMSRLDKDKDNKNTIEEE
jgi:hypothetical protein